MQKEKPSNKQRLQQKTKLRLGMFVVLLLLSAIAVLLFYPRTSTVEHKPSSNYAIHKRQDFNQSQFYPLNQTVNPDLYQPIDKWVGRLVLPNQQQIQPGSDWVWMEVQHAPPETQNLVGKVVRLEWLNKPESQSYVQAVQQDISFTDETRESQAKGIIHPFRLDGRLQVGPLQSLAGARPKDDVIVTLDDGQLVKGSDNQPRLQIAHEPVMATGRFYGLVKILNPEPASSQYPASPICPGTSPCPSDFFRVRHYNRVSGNFDGVEETVRIPQQVIDTRNIPPSTPREMEKSPAGQAGWYIYGAKNTQGIFVVQGIVPRSLLKIQPQHVVLGEQPGLTYIKNQNWQISPQDKGTIRTVLLDPSTNQDQLAPSNWQEGDRAIVLHNFGGIGGKKSEGSTAYTITGHFAFGLAQVVRDPITKELQFAIEYQQIYANNSDGIIAGRHSWADYMGNLQWGWAATRPISDVLIKFAPVTQDYNFDGIKLSPVTEFQRQLQIMMARYRTGDGTGSATVTPATSCVQDASQALYIAIQVISQQVASNPAIQQWLSNHPHDPQTERFGQLVRLSSDLQRQLTPLGIVRADWKSHADYLTGIGDGTEPFRDGVLPSVADRSPWAALTSWRTMVPRQAHDEIAALFFRHGAKLWFLRTNQIGGENPDIAPVAPTLGLGEITIPFTNIAPIPILLNRLLASLVVPEIRDWLVAGITVFIYGAISLPLGWLSGFLSWCFTSTNPLHQLAIALRVIITPAIAEELVFRVLLLPHPLEVINWYGWTLWAGFILLLFILYHPLNAKTLYRVGFPTFFHPIFLTLTGLLGLCCTIAYALTGSLWAIVLIHWIVVLVWLLALGGREKLLISQ
ncbi:type II CAAX prenyl endopeptidase Rce1 family protein [Nostoc parmelioides]|uniref:CPBP family intramembrane metalloprotease n=1 Tax=Nostoc parmelioides FACHB-3921 TaxID=2692909 RepID=A0ABR8B9K1_9NOSO|nr:CPBP family glutamic-type intramembrane protease [Nostoc parmelioides]MBD2250440.1 CPBP family intramembrane metalloprotease [Nostoc parmelioides FACHB-3921]